LAAVEQMVDDGLVPDVVAITGDVARTGSRDEYEEAAKWIDRGLMKCLPSRFPKSRILMVPGNHDVDRSSVKTSTELLQERLLRQQDQNEIAKILNDEHERSNLLRRHNNYLEFANRHRTAKQKLDVP